jgi:hypothetical protein
MDDKHGVVFGNHKRGSLSAKLFQGPDEKGYILVVQTHAGFIEKVY